MALFVVIILGDVLMEKYLELYIPYSRLAKIFGINLMLKNILHIIMRLKGVINARDYIGEMLETAKPWSHKVEKL